MWHAWERGETCTGFWWESPMERDHLNDQGVDGRVESKLTLGRWLKGGVEWIQLAQDRDRWRAVVNAVMNLRVLAPRGWLANRLAYRCYSNRAILEIATCITQMYLCYTDFNLYTHFAKSYKVNM
jgi:hypothetical protein